MNAAYFTRLSSSSHSGTYFRAVNSLFLATALSTAHTVTLRSRFSAGTGYETLYLTEDHVTALFEVRAIVGVPWSPGLILSVPGASWTVVSVMADLKKTVDLRDAAAQRKIETTSQELTGDWEGYRLRATMSRPPLSYLTGTPPTHELGAFLWANGFDGLLTPSAIIPYRTNLIIFPQNLLATGGSFSYTDPLTGARITLP